MVHAGGSVPHAACNHSLEARDWSPQYMLAIIALRWDWSPHTMQAITAWRWECSRHCKQSQPGGESVSHTASNHSLEVGLVTTLQASNHSLEVGVFLTLQAITACRWEWPGQRDLAHPTCVYSLSLSVLLLSPHPPHPSGVLVYRVCASGCKYFLWLN